MASISSAKVCCSSDGDENRCVLLLFRREILDSVEYMRATVRWLLHGVAYLCMTDGTRLYLYNKNYGIIIMNIRNSSTTHQPSVLPDLRVQISP